MSELSDKVREMFTTLDDIRDEGLKAPDDVERYNDICYGDDRKWQMLDVYRPKEAEGCLPVIVSVHGGAWMYGDKERYQFYCMDLARRGFAVVNFTYRLAPEFTFPANIEDTNLVFTWVLEHAAEYGFDTENLFAVGDSAGGSNLGLYAAIITNPEYAEKYDFKVPPGLKISAIALNSSANFIDEQLLPYMADYIPGFGEKEQQLMDIRKHVTSAYPPTFIMTAEEDILKTLAGPLADVLAEKNVPFVYHYYVGRTKAIGHVFHLDIRLKEGILCNDEECAFFQSWMKHI